MELPDDIPADIRQELERELENMKVMGRVMSEALEAMFGPREEKANAPHPRHP